MVQKVLSGLLWWRDWKSICCSSIIECTVQHLVHPSQFRILVFELSRIRLLTLAIAMFRNPVSIVSLSEFQCPAAERTPVIVWNFILSEELIIQGAFAIEKDTPEISSGSIRGVARTFPEVGTSFHISFSPLKSQTHYLLFKVTNVVTQIVFTVYKMT